MLTRFVLTAGICINYRIGEAAQTTARTPEGKSAYAYELRPFTPVERTLFSQVVLAAWNIQRANRLEAGLATTLGVDPLLSEDKTLSRITAARGSAAANARHRRVNRVIVGGDVMGVDWRINIDQAWMDISYRSAVQGNLDPAALFAPLPELKAKVHELMKRTGTRPGHIINLGHGILPETPVDHVQAMVDFVREFKP